MIETTIINSNRSKDVAIIGMGLRLPGCTNTPLELWENLMSGFDGIVETTDRWSDTFADMGEISSKYAGLVELDEWMSFDPLFFGINPADAKQIDPQQKLLLKACWEAFEDAQIDPLTLRGSDTTVYIGASSMDYAAVNWNPHKKALNCFNQNLSGVSNRISYCFDFRQTSLTIDSACSSSLNAVHLGYESIVNGKSNYSVVGGCNFIINPQQSRSFTTANVIGKSGRCKPFDESADGFVRSEGVVVFILKNFEMAISDGDQIYSIIKGGSSNVDGTLNKSNFFAPSKTSQTNNIKNAFESTNGELSPSDIDFFEVHGTGTQIGDPIEVEAVANVFKDVKNSDNPLLIGSIKSNIGHLEASSGVASLAKVCLMFKNREFIKNIHFEKPNPNIKFEEWKVKVCTENTPFPTDKKVSIAINSFGITGSNSCLLLTEYKPTSTTQQPPTTTNKTFLIPISSNSKTSLEKYKTKLVRQVEDYSNLISFQDFINYHINSKAIKLASRSVLVAKDWNDIINSTDSFITTKSNKSGNIIKNNNKNPSLVFIFCGLGPQWSKMGQQLYDNEPIFKQSMDIIDQIFSKHYGHSVLSKLRAITDDDTAGINDFNISQPTIFMIQVSLFELYKSWGITPSISVGHSFGEIPSAYCSNMIDLETACFIIYKRATVQTTTIGSGRMLAIGLNEAEFKEQYSTTYPLVEISCYNSSSSIVINGSEQDLTNISNSLIEKKVFSVMLGSLSALHSSKQEVIKDKILGELKDIKSQSPSIPTFSTVTSNLFNDLTIFDNNYVYDNIRKPVLFEQTISNIFKHIENNDLGSSVLFLELSPSPTLTLYIKEMIPTNSNYFYSEDDSISVLSSLNKKNLNEVQEIQSTISQLYCNGYNVKFNRQLATEHSKTKEFTSHLLPRYQWDDSIYFKQGRISKQRTQGPSSNQLGYRSEISPFISFTSYIDIKEEPFKFFKGHQSRGRCLFAGNGYIDNVLKVFPQQDITFHSIEFKSQLILKEGIKQCITTNIYASSKNEYRVTFHYKDSVSGKWVQSCFGRFSIAKHNSDSQNHKLDIESLKSKCNWTTVKRKELYEAIKIKTNLALSGQFQSVEEASFGHNCCLAKISLGDDTTLSSYDNESFLNICTIDGGFQVFGLPRKTPDIVVLDKIELLRFYSDNIPTSAAYRDKYKFIYVYTEYVRNLGNSVYTNITATLPDGTILFNTPVVCFTAITSTKNNLSIENPDHQLYSTCLQSIESPLSITSPTLTIDDNLFLQCVPNQVTNFKKAITTCLFANLKKKYQSITPAQIRESSIEFLIESYLKISENDNLAKKNLGVSIFEIFKINNEFIEYGAHAKLLKLLSSSQIQTINKISEILLKESPAPNTNYSPVKPHIGHNFLIDEIITGSINPLINERIVFRILEIGCGIGELSSILIEKLNLFLQQNPNAEIDIEFTFSDNQDVNANLIKNRLSLLIDEAPVDTTKDLSSRRPSLVFKLLDLNDKELISSKLINPSYYDIVLLNNLNGINDLNVSIDLIYQILNPNGYLLLVDTLFKPNTTNNEFENYQQWLSYNCIGSTKKDISNWKQLLSQDFKFINFIATNSEPYLILVQKPKYIDTITKESPISYTIGQYDQAILFGKVQDLDKAAASTKLMDVNKQGTDIYMIHTIEDFESHVVATPLTEKSVIIFMSTINDVILEDFKPISMDYIKINQHLLKSDCGAKHVLLTRNACKEPFSNVLAGSVIGSFRYFCEFPQLNIYLMDFDDSIYEMKMDLLNLTNELTDIKKHIQREYIFRGDKIYYERVTQETNLKIKYQSNSYVSEKEGLYAKLNQNLQYQLKALEAVPSGHVEIKVLATGINFKDNLVYRRLVPSEAVNHNGDPNDPEFGYECSGIVTRVGEGVTKFKPGDEVVGLGFNCTGSHVVLQQYRFVFKPKMLTHVEAASIPVVYLTSYYSLFIAGYLNIEKKESVLIHGGSGGIGLSCLNILKAKGFSGLLFVTVGSKEKENYLRNTYGNFITGIYSSKNIDYLIDIKKKIQEVTGNDLIFKEFGISKMGVDLIINTLSSEFMDANFNSLAQGGRVIDLSVTHLNSSDTTDFNKFKYCIGYSTVELLLNGFERNRLILQEIMDMFVNENLALLPIKEYPVSEIKEAIEFINERKHIGKIVVNHENFDLVESTLASNDYEFYKDYLIPNPNYKISNNCNLGKTVLLTGQQGLSLSIIKWILTFNSSDQPVENIIVLSLSPIKYELEILIGICKFTNQKVKILFKQVDISNYEELEKAVTQVYSDNECLPMVGSIFHNAFIPSECDPLEIDMNHLDKSHAAKIIGVLNLHTLSMMWMETLKNFVLASSITSVLGSQRQCGYVSANCTLDSFARLRNAIGLPCTVINWGVLGSTGFVSRNEGVSKLFEYQGFIPISTDIVYGTLDLFLQNPQKSCQKIVASFNYDNVCNAFKDHSLSYKLDYFLNPVYSKNSTVDENELSIKEEILNKFSEILSTEQSKINLDIKLLDYGADSLLIVELKNWLDKTYSPNILSIVQLQNVTINQLIQSVTTAVSKLKLRKPTTTTKKPNNTNTQSKIDWEQELKLDPTIKPTNEMIETFKQSMDSVYRNNNKGGIEILLTGACSFLGVYLLFNLLNSPKCKSVYCILTNDSKEDALAAITQSLKTHGLLSQLTALEMDKIVPIIGDFTKDILGLVNNDQYIELSKKIDLIINAASNTTKHFCALIKYEDVDKDYLVGVNNCLKFACSQKLKRFLQISSMGIYSDSEKKVLNEYTFPDVDYNHISKQSHLVSGYMQSKIVAEYHIKEASIRGIPSMIIRTPFTFSGDNGIGRPFDFIQLFTQSCYALSSYPTESHFQLYISPVTWYAKSISLMLLGNNDDGCWEDKSSPIQNLLCYNLFGKSIDFGNLLQELATDLSWKEISFIQFIKKAATVEQESCKKLSSFINKQEDFLRNLIIPNNYSLNEFVKNLLVSNNSYEGWQVTKELIVNHLSWAFKKKIL